MSIIHFKAEPELTFKSIVNVRKRLYDLLMQNKLDPHLNFDLSEVTHCDSAGLALLIEVRKLCKKNNKTFDIIGMSRETQSLAEFCGVKNILEKV